MKINDSIHGFKVTRIRPVKELEAEMVEMTFEKNGAKLIWLKRDDTNKTFAITFRTTPEDDTGVFHILEHSVLCGSEKYPLKEPFVDLLKGSMQTFLNAMTFLDKTMYPVASRNNKDFLNLIDVYMDAVLHPLIYQKKEIFMQEGWHFEENDGELSYNGVVYNEMQGVFSSVENRFIYELLPRLYPDTCYGHCSGGNPKYIPNLTYEGFIETHKRFYHPSNSTIFLDGDVDLESVLALLESYLADYDKKQVNTEIAFQPAVNAGTVIVPYEACESDGVFGKTEIAKGFVAAPFHERGKIMALGILADTLCATNESPLKKALLDEKLAEDVVFETDDVSKQCTLYLVLRGVKDENVQKAEETVRKVFSDLFENGINKKQLTAAFNRCEFETREKDFGTEPAGLIYAMKAQETWLYGGDPYDALVYDDIFDSLRVKIESGYFENLLKETFIDNNHVATVYMVPDKDLAAKNAAEKKQKLSQIQQTFSAEDLKTLKEENEKLRLFQTTPDSPEQSQLIKHLELSDISEKCEKLPLEKHERSGVKVLVSDTGTSGIVYTDLYFSLAGFTKEELCTAALMRSMLSRNATKSFSSSELAVALMTELGSFSCQTHVAGKSEADALCTPYFVASAGALESKKDKIISLVPEILKNTVFDEKNVSDILAQLKLSYENSVKSNGHLHAMRQVQACLSQKGAVNEMFFGRTRYDYLCKCMDNPKQLCEKMATLCKKIFTKDRLTLAVIGKDDEKFTKSLIGCFEQTGEKIGKINYAVSENKKQKIPVTSNVSYASKGYNVPGLSPQMKGKIEVACKILSLDYLWNEIRVKGGAYGAGVRTDADGNIVFYSYRDPKPDSSLATYDNSGEALLAFSKENSDITKYIIGAISASEPVLSPYNMGHVAIVRFLDEITYEQLCQKRKGMLETTAKDLEEIANLFELKNKNCAECIIGA